MPKEFETDFEVGVLAVYGILSFPLMMALISLMLDVRKAYGGTISLGVFLGFSILSSISYFLLFLANYGLIYHFYKTLEKAQATANTH